MNFTKENTIMVKNLVGNYTDLEIGHEIINSFDHDNNTPDGYQYLYIPPYGFVGSKSNSKFINKTYLSKKNIFFFDKTNIPYVLKLKAVAVDVESLTLEEIDNICNSLSYNSRNIRDIFKNENTNEIKNEFSNRDAYNTDQDISLITYKVKKKNYYNLDDKNILVLMEKPSATINIDNTNEICKIIYNSSPFELTETIFGQKNYRVDIKDDFINFIDTIKENFVEENKYNLHSLTEYTNTDSYIYRGNNFLGMLHMENLENLETNFIEAALNNNEELKSKFFSYLVQTLFGIEDYVTNNVRLATQVETLSQKQKWINSYVKNKSKDSIKNLTKHYPELDLDSLTEDDIYPDGFIDLYIRDDTYRVVIENKINSDLNGKDVINGTEISQLDKYKKMLEETGNINTSKVCLLVPNNKEQMFVNLNYDVLLYSNLATFFNSNRDETFKYEDEFIDSLYLHAYSKEELTALKFKKATE